MFSNYLKLAFRNLARNKTFSLINILGMAIGLTCCFLISMYLVREFGYDKHHDLAARIYQVGAISTSEGKSEKYAPAAAPLAPLMQQNFPEIESYLRITNLFEDDKTLLTYKDGNELKSFYETNGYMADSTMFRIMSYKFIEGNAATCLNDRNGVVLSSEIARKMFGDQPALNKTITINSTTNGVYNYIVTGVFLPPSSPTHINARFVMSINNGSVGEWMRSQDDLVNNSMFYTYLLLKPGADPGKLESKFKPFVTKYAGEDLKGQARSAEYFLTPVKDIHLASDIKGNITPAASLTYLYILLSIAVVTLLIACVNFMNLSTARSSKRAVEIGVRKVLGAEKTSLIRQFLFEAILISLIAFLLSLILSQLLSPFFEQASGMSYSFSKSEFLALAAVFFFISLGAGLIAGLYPAFYLSAFKPVRVLKGRFTNSLAAVSFRKVLVVFQFVISVALIIASITISNQMNYLRTKELGFQKDRQLVIPLRTSTAKETYLPLKNSIGSNSSVIKTGAALYKPGYMHPNWIMYKQGRPATDVKSANVNFIDQSFLQTLELKLLAGRLFSKEFPGDTANSIVINQHAVKEFGFASPQDAIGKSLAATRGDNEVLFPIVGVINDFHFRDLHSPIESYMFLLSRDPSYNYLVANVKEGDMQSTIDFIRSSWNKLNPNEAFEYNFLDEDFHKNYVADEKLASLIKYFTIIAIFISCLGLLGLTSFSVEQRTKEIGIRKVLGASTPVIVSLISRDFLKLVFVSFFIACPLAWYFLNKWLETFAYRAPFTIWILLAACLLALIIAFLTISFQAIKAAISDPVKSLRTE